MSYIDQNEINKIRTSVDIVDIVSEYVPLTKKGRNYFGICPFHDDHSPSMSVSPEKHIYKCFTCGATGNVFTFIQEYENVSFIEAVKMVANKAGINVTSLDAMPQVNKNQKYYDLMSTVSKYYQNNLKTKNGIKAKEYLINRGISEEIINEFGIGLALDDRNNLRKFLVSKGYLETDLYDLGLINKGGNEYYDQLSGRIIFPLCNSSGDVIGFTGRIYRGEDTAKYVNTKETEIFKKGENLYNYHLAVPWVKKEKSVIVVEGQMDAIRLYTEGFKNVVASGGTSFTKEQMALLKKLKAKVILCFDNDKAGEMATYKVGEELAKEKLELQVVRLSDAKDPDEYIKKFGAEAFKNNLKNVIKFLDFKMLYLKNNQDLNNSVDLSNYINNVLVELAKEKDEILKDIILKKLSNDYNIDIDILRKKSALTKVDLLPTVLKTPVKSNTRKTQVDQAMEKIIYFMMNNPIYIKMYEKRLGFMAKDVYRSIANEIIYYYDLNKDINMADFISFVSNKEHISKTVLDIVNTEEDILINEIEMENYIKIVKTKIEENEIVKLKEKMKTELDINKKIEIANKIAKLKKGCVVDDWGN